MKPVSHWKQNCIRSCRNQDCSYQNSAGFIVPIVSLGKPREREGTLLQLTRLKGDENVQLPTG
jgi:hypothetical protein